MTETEYDWWDKERVADDEVHNAVFTYVPEVERRQSYLFDRFYKLNCLYDPYYEHISGFGSWYDRFGTDYLVSENVIASSVDTVTGIVAATEVRTRFIPTDGDFKTQRQAKHLEWYIEGLDKKLRVHQACVDAFKDAALKGTGLVKVFRDWETDEICVERVPVDDIIVDEIEARSGRPLQIHQRIFASADVLKAKYPEHAEAIERASGGGQSDGGRFWADYRPYNDGQCVVIESWHLGKRHSICIDGATLFVEDYDERFFPFGVTRWSRRPSGWYGVGGAERVAGHQRVLNKTNWQIDRQLDQLAVPTTFVRHVDAKLAVTSTNRAGSVVPVKGEYPQTRIPNAVSPETYQRQVTVKDSAFEEFGVSRLAATAKKPAGIESGAGLREYRDATTQRFAPQEKGFEQLRMDVDWLIIRVCKDLGDAAPNVVRKVYGGKRTIEWSDVDMGEIEFNMQPASNLARTPAGKRQFALELAQAGVISKDSATKLMELEDVDGELSLYTAAVRHIDMIIEHILDGGDATPSPSGNLKLSIWRVQMAMLNAEMAGAPERIIETLREFNNQTAFILNPPEVPSAAPIDPALGAPPMEQQAPPLDPMAGSSAPMPAVLPEAVNPIA